MLFFAVSGFAAITQSSAHQKAYNYIKGNLPSDYVFMYKKAKTNSILIANKSKKTLSEDCWVFFLDEQPNSNWGHKCTYVYVSVSTGKVKSSTAYWPPKDLSDWENSEYNKKNNNTMTNGLNNGVSSFVDANGLIAPGFYNNLTPLCRKATDFKGNSYAVIISGGADMRNNHIRYWNDCAIYYQMLTRLYGIPRNNIYVYMSDGTDPASDLHLGASYESGTIVPSHYISSPLDLDGDGTNDITGAAEINAINQGFLNLKNALTPEDNLFIFTTDHGDSDGALMLWDFNKLYPTDLANMLRGIQAPISIVMEQCFSGSFVYPIEALGQKITIATAVHKNQTSSGDYYYNPFAYKWACGYAGYDPVNNVSINADADGDNQITMSETFDYSKDVKYGEKAQYWSYGGAAYGSSTVDVFVEKPNYWANVGLLGNYQTADATFGCDYSSLNAGGPQKILTVNGNINNKTKTYIAGYKINSACKMTGSNIQFKAADRISLKTGFKATTSTLKATVSTCDDGVLRSFEIPEDYTYELTQSPIELEEFIDMNGVSYEDLVIYPNPTDGVFYINFGGEEGDKLVSISNVSGKTIYTNSFDGDNAEIDLSGNAQGIYFVHITSNSTSVVKEIILK